MSFNFKAYCRCIPHDADGVQAWRTDFPVLSAEHNQKEYFVYPARFQIGMQKGDFFLVTDADKKVLYHSEAESPRAAIDDTVAAHARQKESLERYRVMGRNELVARIKKIENLVCDGHDFIERAGLCRLGYLAFCKRFGFLPDKIVIHEAHTVRRDEARISLVLYWVVQDHVCETA